MRRVTSTGTQSCIYSLMTTVIVDGSCLNRTAIHTRCVTIVPMMQLNSLSSTKLVYVTSITINVQSLSIRGVPVSMASTMNKMTACIQVSVTLYTVTTIPSIPH